MQWDIAAVEGFLSTMQIILFYGAMEEINENCTLSQTQEMILNNICVLGTRSKCENTVEVRVKKSICLHVDCSLLNSKVLQLIWA